MVTACGSIWVGSGLNPGPEIEVWVVDLVVISGTPLWIGRDGLVYCIVINLESQWRNGWSVRIVNG